MRMFLFFVFQIALNTNEIVDFPLDYMFTVLIVSCFGVKRRNLYCPQKRLYRESYLKNS